MSPEQFEELTYAMWHMYPNWPNKHQGSPTLPGLTLAVKL